MANVDFKALLSKPAESIEKPKPMPVGTYLGVITGHEFGESKQKKTPYVRFKLKPVQADADVNLEDLALVKDPYSKEFRQDYYITEDSLFRLKDFIEKDLGMSIAGRTLMELVPETTNASVKFVIGHRFDENDPNNVFAEVTKVMAA